VKFISVSEADFSVEAELAALADRRAGAQVCFVGRVRDSSPDADLHALTLEHYPGMTEAEIDRILEAAAARWPLTGIRVIHRVGRLMPEEQIVLVAVASAHRKAAFEAAHFIMDYLKTEAPFWKAEERADGQQWVEARQTDEAARASWD
jgi:molybdopterin synthase catalytic subunit